MGLKFPIFLIIIGIILIVIGTALYVSTSDPRCVVNISLGITIIIDGFLILIVEVKK